MTTQHGRHPATESPDAERERRLTALEMRVQHLEQELEGLQDALYRQATLADEQIGELRRRIEPDQMARDLNQDARKRGL
jgi:uncharacterized coiled-coil protein SlyX